MDAGGRARRRGACLLGCRTPPPPPSPPRADHRRTPQALCRRAASAAGAFGVCALVVAYALLGAVAFSALEGGTFGGGGGGGGGKGGDGGRSGGSGLVGDIRSRTVERLWSITEDLNILYKENWTRLASREVLHFQETLVRALRRGGYGRVDPGEDDGSHRWSFASSFLYSLTLITTIGCGGMAPRTAWGKVAAMAYALVGIPLVLLYLSAVGEALAGAFRRFYGRVCPSRFLRHSSLRRPTPSNHYTKSQKVPDGVLKMREAAAVLDGGLSLPRKRLARRGDGGLSPSPPPPPPPPPRRSRSPPPVRVPATLCLLLVAAYVCGGALLFRKLEGWTFLEGSFFCFSSLGTIGFGDLAPGASRVHARLPAAPDRTGGAAGPAAAQQPPAGGNPATATTTPPPGGAETKAPASGPGGRPTPGPPPALAPNGSSSRDISVMASSAYILAGMALVAMCFNLVQEEAGEAARRFARLLRLLPKDSDMGSVAGDDEEEEELDEESVEEAEGPLS
ncbi:potassium channel subfamily K member 18-like [Ischnura elegans]|uniref:potassium channel subfamily K member 18-like n=1 Tax=Ischnura elegans TaxID=197161 RepID=UPI001ED8778B|nr:potassium channel subfamily K member 18-like [Ischnura elegans]